ncbi:MAG: hypothetical protein ABIG66_00840 [Candidatus Kerfeldbacteria bacterium]
MIEIGSSVSLIIAGFFMSLGLSFVLIPSIRKWHINKELLYEDMNKPNKPKVPGMGGLGMVCSFLIAINVLISAKTILGINSIEMDLLFPAILSITLISFVGLLDDMIVFSFRWVKPALVLIASIPMLSILYSVNLIVDLPGLPAVYIGELYPLLIIPFLIAFGANAVNIMADFDGLLPGNGYLMTASLFVCAWISQNATALFILAILAGSLLVFYFYNRYPAKLFAGNIGTLFVGGTLAVTALVGDMKLPFLILMVPYGIHLLLQERFAWDEHKLTARPTERGVIQPDGTLKSPYTKAYGLTHWLMLHGKKMTEQRLVQNLMLMELVFALLAVLVYLARDVAI